MQNREANCLNKLLYLALMIPWVCMGETTNEPNATSKELMPANTNSLEQSSEESFELKEKGEKIEELDTLVEELSGSLAAANIMLHELSPKSTNSDLKDMERKAFKYDVISDRLKLKDSAIATLKADLTASQRLAANQKKEIEALTTKFKATEKKLKKMEKEQVPIKEALRLIQLGKYEYYEIKEGDTCESIAALDTVFGDETKHVLIRQANQGNIKDLDKLEVGEMLIIPRFTISESYEF